MSTVNVNGARVYFEDQGGAGETVVFSHGLLFDRRMFDDQVKVLSAHFRCVAFDWRGQGATETTRSGYDMDSLTDDAAAFIGALGLAPCHFIGLSMGGYAGLDLAIRRPELLRSLVLMSAPAEAWSPGTAARMLLLAHIARVFGLRSVVGRVMSGFFGPTFNSDPEREDERAFWRAQVCAVDRVGAYRTVLGLASRRGVTGELGRITTPTLIIAGEEDINFPHEEARRMAAGIPHAELVTIPHAGHYSAIEQPEDVTRAIASFLSRVSAPSSAQAFGSKGSAPE